MASGAVKKYSLSSGRITSFTFPASSARSNTMAAYNFSAKQVLD
jgi:hypothetical protein